MARTAKTKPKSNHCFRQPKGARRYLRQLADELDDEHAPKIRRKAKPPTSWDDLGYDYYNITPACKR